jgi:hypothetical protein
MIVIVISWILAVVAIGFQLLSIAITIHSPRASQIYAVPVLLWYPALMLRGRGFFLASPGKEILAVLAIHIVLSVAISMIARARSKG